MSCLKMPYLRKGGEGGSKQELVAVVSDRGECEYAKEKRDVDARVANAVAPRRQVERRHRVEEARGQAPEAPVAQRGVGLLLVELRVELGA